MSTHERLWPFWAAHHDRRNILTCDCRTRTGRRFHSVRLSHYVKQARLLFGLQRYLNPLMVQAPVEVVLLDNSPAIKFDVIAPRNAME
jgi:hypothetical protein